MPRRSLLTVALAVFLVLAGSGVATAYWSTHATVNATVSAAAAGSLSQTGFESLAMTYSAPSTLRVTTAVTVTNTGASEVTYALALGRQSGNALSSAVLIRSWTVASAGLCTNHAAESGVVTAGSWDSMPATTGSLAPAASSVVCHRMSITASQASSLMGQSMVGTLTLTSSNAWSAPVAATIIQKVADTTPPSAPVGLTATGTTSSRTTLSWSPSTDNVTTGPSISYLVYRDGDQFASIATTANPITITAGFLAPGTTYTFTVRAKDQAGNLSPPASVTVTTLPAGT